MIFLSDEMKEWLKQGDGGGEEEGKGRENEK